MNIGHLTIAGELSADRRHWVLEVSHGEKVLSRGSIDAADLDELIAGLAVARKQLAEEVAPALEPVCRMNCLSDPGWAVATPQADGRRVLVIRHPGLGWLGFAFAPEQAEAIFETLCVASPNNIVHLPARKCTPDVKEVKAMIDAIRTGGESTAADWASLKSRAVKCMVALMRTEPEPMKSQAAECLAKPRKADLGMGRSVGNSLSNSPSH